MMSAGTLKIANYAAALVLKVCSRNVLFSRTKLNLSYVLSRMLLEHEGDKLRAFRLYRDSDVYTLGTRIGGLGEDELKV